MANVSARVGLSVLLILLLNNIQFECKIIKEVALLEKPTKHVYPIDIRPPMGQMEEHLITRDKEYETYAVDSYLPQLDNLDIQSIMHRSKREATSVTTVPQPELAFANASNVTATTIFEPIAPDDAIMKFIEVLNPRYADTNKTQLQNNLTSFQEEYHVFYNSTTRVDEVEIDKYWKDFKNFTTNEFLSGSYRRAKIVQLSFDFPFYGHPIRNVTVATGGFISTSEYLHSWLAATQYIAPLMANFDPSISNDSYVKYKDNGTSFTVIWENVTLQEQPEIGKFTFSASLFNTGDVMFAYYSVPVLVESIQDDIHPVKVGLSEAYMMDKKGYFSSRKTIYEYHRVNFGNEYVRNGTIIYLNALETCPLATNCDACMSQFSQFSCTWCPALNRCSSGMDRHRQEWLNKSCDKIFLTDTLTCQALGAEVNNAAAQENQNFTEVHIPNRDGLWYPNGTNMLPEDVDDNGYHEYYNSTTRVDEGEIDKYWKDFKYFTTSGLLSGTYRRAMTVQLSFDFPFYGHPIRNVTVATGGFLYTGEYIHSWFTGSQYIAPLMANFDPSATNDAFVKYKDNGTSFTVIWENVILQEHPEIGKFTFSASLFNTGDIMFAYYSVPLLVESIQDNIQPVKVGLSDAYMMDQENSFTRRNIFYEYHRVNFGNEYVRNGTIIYLSALETCASATDCEACVLKFSQLSCTWCPALNHCSFGIDRHRQEWFQKSCNKIFVTDRRTCPALGATGNNAVAQENQNFTEVYIPSRDGLWYPNGTTMSPEDVHYHH